MTTPLRAARIAKARMRVAELLAGRCNSPEAIARELIDELLNLGWTYPGWQVDDHVPQPSYSTPQGRARARAEFERIREAHREIGQRDEYPHLH